MPARDNICHFMIGRKVLGVEQNKTKQKT
jgi:hypothetical protein